MIKLIYFPIRGRGEMIRLALVYAGVDYEDESVDYQVMKADPVKFPFGQVPALLDDEGLFLVQSNAILRHLGRKYDMYGSSLTESAYIDIFLDGVEDIRQRYANLIYQDKVSDEAKATYYKMHVDPTTTCERNGGAHFAYIERIAARCANQGLLNGTLSIAHIACYDIYGIHMRIFPEMLKMYPALEEMYSSVEKHPTISHYTGSARLHTKVNGNGLG